MYTFDYNSKTIITNTPKLFFLFIQYNVEIKIYVCFNVKMMSFCLFIKQIIIDTGVKLLN